MSKAFTKDDAVEAPVVVPTRAPLPSGVPNYVTARGLAELRSELAALEADRDGGHGQTADGSDNGLEEARASSLATRITDLAGRVASAVLVEPEGMAHDEVRFGATVTVRTAANGEHRYQIVGVDEADAAAGRIAFLSPLAKALLGRRVGDTTLFRTGRGEEELEILAIGYDDRPA